ncbi:hypothetical protein CC85DRAFT_287281 [Cutaneotrichosporon oleaginosum]|uniref:Uncharacterized protein n=1 Tax=Cutaneotrichosporon oleaginosum TaxID=879819 RepID=A0A0J0XI31_9TREE|nr:uncharacterized protein CC85DRAFT_287281 [Cutaneotrichosporon oleaginosum]KLT40667.1 hypothetical protein CC85DRAFT_287281 [Cutaneotrichosporon oleaginosum]TXT12477.1 hypothetical protein COLE_02887 [Cutaneotrichosporon oleaginosum]
MAATKNQQAKARSSAILDLEMFPHIADLIMNFAPHASLVKLRATSRYLKRRSEAVLFRHLLIDSKGRFSTPKGLLPKLAQDEFLDMLRKYTRVVEYEGYIDFTRTAHYLPSSVARDH